MLNAAIIGCGETGQIHAQCLAKLDRIRLYAVCDRDWSRANELQKQGNVPIATDRPEVIFASDHIDLVYIATHTASHKELCLQAIQSRKHFMIEKPVCLTAADAKEVGLAAAAVGIKSMVAMKFRFYDLVNKARTLITDPYMISVQVMDDPWPQDFWANDPQLGGGNVISQGVHGADLLRFLAGAEPVSVFSVGGNYHQPTGVVDNLSAVIRFDNGLAGTLVIGDCGQPPQIGKFMIQIFGKHGVALLSDRLTRLQFHNLHTGETVDFTGKENGFLEENRAFIDMIENNAAPVSTIWDGYMAQAIIEAAIASAKKPRCIRFDRSSRNKKHMKSAPAWSDPVWSQTGLGRQWRKSLTAALFAYEQRRARFWQPCYESPEKFQRSLQRNRERWAGLLAVPEPWQAPAHMEIIDQPNQDKLILCKLADELSLSALFRQPDGRCHPPYPLVIFQHGIDGSAHMVMGEDDTDPKSYHAIGAKLVAQGFAVLAPTAINNFHHRNQINRMALLLGSNIWALEIHMIRTFLTYAAENLAIDRNRIAMWGHSMGGAYTLYTMPLESKIRAGIISAWFNHRLAKMLVEDARYTCFLNTEEEHAFLPGLLTAFSDQDLVGLICPRPLLIQSGASDSVAWPPLVEKEYQQSRMYYDRLGLGDRIQWDQHPGGHEINADTGIAFLQQWLN